MITDLAAAYGRGYRRCFETIRKTPALYILIGAGAYDDARSLLRDLLIGHDGRGREFLEGWDSVDTEPGEPKQT